MSKSPAREELLPLTAGMSKASAKAFLNNAKYMNGDMERIRKEAARILSIGRGGKPGVIPTI